MGLFRHKHSGSLSDEALEEVELLFDDAFREELKAHGQAYFERVINENAALFKQDLDATVAHINTELRQHVARQLDHQFAEINRVNGELREHIAKRIDEQLVTYDKTIENAQGAALASLDKRTQSLEEKHQQLSAALEKSFAHQDAMLTSTVTDSQTRLDGMRGAQEAALKSLTESVKMLQDQHQQLSQMLQETIVKQQDMLVNAFEENMASIIEHYLVGVLGDQYDLKAQLPAIIQQMEQNKQVMADDMKL